MEFKQHWRAAVRNCKRKLKRFMKQIKPEGSGTYTMENSLVTVHTQTCKLEHSPIKTQQATEGAEAARAQDTTKSVRGIGRTGLEADEPEMKHAKDR